MAQHRGDYPAAEALLGRSLEIKERLGDRARMVRSHLVLAGLKWRQADRQAASELAAIALGRAEALGLAREAESSCQLLTRLGLPPTDGGARTNAGDWEAPREMA